MKETQLIVANLENFISGIASNLDSLDWHGKRDIIRQVVKRIEVGPEELNIVYKMNKLSESQNLQHCCNRTLRCVGV